MHTQMKRRPPGRLLLLVFSAVADRAAARQTKQFIEELEHFNTPRMSTEPVLYDGVSSATYTIGRDLGDEGRPQLLPNNSENAEGHALDNSFPPIDRVELADCVLDVKIHRVLAGAEDLADLPGALPGHAPA